MSSSDVAEEELDAELDIDTKNEQPDAPLATLPAPPMPSLSERPEEPAGDFSSEQRQFYQMRHLELVRRMNEDRKRRNAGASVVHPPHGSPPHQYRQIMEVYEIETLLPPPSITQESMRKTSRAEGRRRSSNSSNSSSSVRSGQILRRSRRSLSASGRSDSRKHTDDAMMESLAELMHDDVGATKIPADTVAISKRPTT